MVMEMLSMIAGDGIALLSRSLRERMIGVSAFALLLLLSF